MDKKDFNYKLNLVDALDSLEQRGAFLTVKDNEDRVNTMTIGWGNIGYEWGRPVFIVLVRESRYTHELLENADDFTISIPLDDKMNKALGFCGSKSGRDYDKFKEWSLNVLNSDKVKSPSIGDCQMIYECKIIYKHDMDLQLLDEEIRNKWYSSESKHTIYYGEIVNCYQNN